MLSRLLLRQLCIPIPPHWRGTRRGNRTPAPAVSERRSNLLSYASLVPNTLAL
jgi:hypothetical protein